MTERVVDVERAHSLARWLAWVGIVRCTCPYAWRSLGTLYRVSFGKGWVRMLTEAGCPEHDQ